MYIGNAYFLTRLHLFSTLKRPKTLMKREALKNTSFRTDAVVCWLVKMVASESGDQKKASYTVSSSRRDNCVKSLRFWMNTRQCGQLKTKRVRYCGENNIWLRFGYDPNGDVQKRISMIGIVIWKKGCKSNVKHSKLRSFFLPKLFLKTSLPTL